MSPYQLFRMNSFRKGLCRATAAFLILITLIAPSWALIDEKAAPPKGLWCQASEKLNGWGQTFSYYLSKLPEAMIIFDADARRMISVGMAAQKNKKNSRMEIISLKDVKLYHPVDNQNAMEKSAKRAKALQEHKEELLKGGVLRSQDYNQLIPSIDPIQLIVYPEGMGAQEGEQGKSYLVIQGQGRMVSIKQVFPPETLIEVEVSELDDPYLKDLTEVRNNYIKNGRLGPQD